MPLLWQIVLLALVGGVVVVGLVTATTLAEVDREENRRENSRVSLLAWSVLNGGRSGTDSAEFTTDGEAWELSASPHFRGILLAVGHLDGVEVGISCTTRHSSEGGTTWHTAVLVHLSEERSPTRLNRREIRRLGLPQRVEAVTIGGRELCVCYGGWPDDFVALNTRVDATVRLAASLQAA